MTDCRLLIDPAAPGAWNMAVDEVLLEWAAEVGGCCWRFYRWSEPTLSLGYFQTYEDRQTHPSSRNCAVVRRASGGGAILHDAELTYSFVAPKSHPLALTRRALYQSVHETLLEVLTQLGLGATLCRSPDRGVVDRQPFLCFQRRSEGDVVLGDIKIAGSAQRRNRGAVLQHGSVLLGRSRSAPELDGVNSFLANDLTGQKLIELWLPRLSSRLELAWYARSLDHQERRRAECLMEAKYGSETWNRHRGRSGRAELL